MSTNELSTIEKIRNLLGERVVEINEKRERRIFLKVNLEDYHSCMKDLVHKLGARHVSTITGLDTGKELEVLVHLFGQGSEITVKASLPRDKPNIKSIIDLVPGADFYEREIHDLLGINFKGNPNMKRFILPEDWPKGVYPLRKDFKKIVGKK
jgi:NADH-quinone oxidoreductase subunit C